MFYSVLKFVHVLAVILWVGGMLFAHCFLRPAAAQLEPPVRLKLMVAVLGPFLNAVLASIVLILVSGAWMIGKMAKEAAQTGGSFFMPLSWTLMACGGLVMMAIFGHIRFALYKRLRAAVAASDWPLGGQTMAVIRLAVGVNLILGIVTLGVVFLV
ncbi:CopD family protein [Achromobacter seleniivolatilans]|uniref:CopD family protein n=1 Tax=Achromobacter seleniivolatilans TaxID=3047478 RepID=A0ABY9M153_9BURK|nr:CopD family protein [Achromobacter sp. R39]WMD20442.1 CopD family protein [Achromobacter sp. R39]